MTESTSTPVPAHELKRQLSFLDAAAIFVGIIIGSGIFVAPAAVAAATSNPWIMAALWLAGATVALCGAFCYAECGARLPHTGGFYVFYRRVYGDKVAFAAGWAALFITYPASIAAIALVFASYLDKILPGVAATPLTTTLTAAFAVLSAGFFNIVGVRVGANVQRLLTGFKVLALLTLAVAVIVAPHSTGVQSAPMEALPLGFAGLVGAVMMLLWTYDGWSDVTMIAGELKHPSRDLGRAVGLGIATLAVTYIIVQLAVTSLLGASGAAASKQVLADAVSVGLGTGAGRGVAFLVVVSTFGSLNGIVLAASRLAFAMAKHGDFFRWFGQVEPRFETPARSTVILLCASLAYVFVSDFRDLMGFFSFNVWLFYAATAVALFVLRYRKEGEPLEWRAPLGFVPPVVILLTATFMTVSLLTEAPGNSLKGLGMLLVLVPLSFVWHRLRKSTLAA